MTAKSKPDDREQSKRFIETAEQVGADSDEKALERALKRISVPRDTKARENN